MIAEMYIFRNILNMKHIDWWDESDDDIHRTLLEHNGKRWSVINGFGTYGGSRRDKPNEGLLEVYDGQQETGWLTAYDAYQLIFEGEQ